MKLDQFLKFYFKIIFELLEILRLYKPVAIGNWLEMLPVFVLSLIGFSLVVVTYKFSFSFLPITRNMVKSHTTFLHYMKRHLLMICEIRFIIS